VNQELSVLERAIPAAIRSLAVEGRVVVLAYQSLEDRIVKRALAAASSSTAPAGLPIELPEHRAELKLLVRGAELASDDEKAANPRSTPVRLRAATRIRRAA
jgi:16S rRNA (cytosine1402-N4)-methyltransferase